MCSSDLEIAVDPRRASRAFHLALRRARISLLPAANLRGAALESQPTAGGRQPASRRLCLIDSPRYGRFGADVFIDASIGGDLAHKAGVPFLQGLGPRGLSRESISLGWIFEVEGLGINRLRQLEAQLTHRLLDRQIGRAHV